MRASPLLALLLLGACIEPGEPFSPPVACSTTGAEGGRDTLDVTVTLDPLEDVRRGEILVRIDPLADAFVTFQPPDPTGSAAALAVTPAGRFVGCVGFAVGGFALRTPASYARHAWLRVASDRPVRVRVQAPDSTRLGAEDPVIGVGASGTLPWRSGEEP